MFRRYRELRKKQRVGFSPSEEIVLLRFHRLHPANKQIAQICTQIRKRYFFCKKREIYSGSHIARIYDDVFITNLLTCGDTELISHFRLASQWNDFLTKLTLEHQSYQYEKRFINDIPVSEHYFFEEDVYIAGRYKWIFDEKKAHNEVCKFRSRPVHRARAKKLNLTIVSETYDNLEEMTQKLWRQIFKKDFVTY